MRLGRIHPVPWRVREKALEQFDKVGACWIWNGSMAGPEKNCPQMCWGEGGETFHIYTYQLMWRWRNDWAAIEDGYDVHHTCHERRCIRPSHLELLTKEEHHTRHHGGPMPEAVYNSNRTLQR